MKDKMDVNAVLEELKEFDLHSFELKDIFRRAIQKKINDTYGLYVSDKELMESDTIENSMRKTMEGITKKYDSIENAKLYHVWDSFCYTVKLIERNEKETKFYVSENNMKEFIYMLRYAIIGVFDKDYSETITYMDLNGIKYNTDKGTFSMGVGVEDGCGIIFKIFKNHNVIVKGLTNEQYNRIKAGYDNYKKYSEF